MATYKDDDIVYFCKDSREIVEPTGEGIKKTFHNSEGEKCKNVAFGTFKSVRNYFHLTK
jgi:hypothetical protein